MKICQFLMIKYSCTCSWLLLQQNHTIYENDLKKLSTRISYNSVCTENMQFFIQPQEKPKQHLDPSKNSCQSTIFVSTELNCVQLCQILVNLHLKYALWMRLVFAEGDYYFMSSSSKDSVGHSVINNQSLQYCDNRMNFNY